MQIAEDLNDEYLIMSMISRHVNPFFVRSYRLKNKRPLGKLMVTDTGCDVNSPGIGDIAFVKDLMTGKIVTTKFQCSVFGLAYSSTVGWVCNKKLCTMCESLCEHKLKRATTQYGLSISEGLKGVGWGPFPIFSAQIFPVHRQKNTEATPRLHFTFPGPSLENALLNLY